MYCKLVKLSNGDDIIITTEEDYNTFQGKEFLVGKNACQVGVVRIPRGSGIYETFILQPWIRMAKFETVNIPVTSVVAMVDVDDKAAKQYFLFVEDKPNISMEVDHFLDLESFEEESYEPQPGDRGRTIH